jgi:uncharacterized phage-associated protein
MGFVSIKYGYSSLEVANEFLRLAFNEDKSLTQMQLQKLAYLSHGYSLAINDGPLVADRVEAWDYGTVFRNLYDNLKFYGSLPVKRLIQWGDDNVFTRGEGKEALAELDPEQTKIIKEVWQVYGDYPAFKLSAITHDPDGPWKKYYKDGESRVIPDSDIREYFSGLIKAGRGRSRAVAV